MANTVAKREVDFYHYVSINQAVATGNSTAHRLEFRIKGDPIADRIFDLVIMTRSPKPNTRIPKADIPRGDELSKIVARTVMNWTNVMKSVIFGIPLPDDRLAGIDSVRRDVDEGDIVGVPECDSEPYCTVYNQVNYYKPGLSVSVHSWDNGEWALSTAYQHINAVDMVKQHSHKFDLIPVELVEQQHRQNQQQQTPPAQSSANQPPATNQQQMDLSKRQPSTEQKAMQKTNLSLMPYLAGKTAWIRECRKDEFVEGILRIENGQKAKPNFNTTAIFPNIPYNRERASFDYPTGTLVAYEIHGKLVSGEYNGSLYIDIPLADNKTFRVFYQPDNDKGEWKILRDRLAIDWEQLQSGMTYGGNVDYLIVKYNDGKAKDNNGNAIDVQYRNLYGLFNFNA